MEKFGHFFKQIPSETMKGVEKFFHGDFALFAPQTYIAGREMQAADYHIIIPSTPPPDTIVNARLFRFDAGKYVTFNPGDSLFVLEERLTEKYLTLLIKPELMNKIAQELGHCQEVRFLNLQQPFSRELHSVIQILSKEIKRPDRSNLMLDCLVTQIIIMALRELNSNIKKHSFRLPDSESFIDLAVEYMQTYYCANITIEDICREINVSRFHFIRSFKQKMGIPPYQYLLNLRIQKAMEMLRSRRYSVAETAELCGFLSSSHFSAKFKEITGYTPSEYRKLN